MKILVDGTNILASGDCQETATEYIFSDVIVPKIVVPNAVFYDVNLPDDFQFGTYSYVNGTFVALPKINPNEPPGS